MQLEQYNWYISMMYPSWVLKNDVYYDSDGIGFPKTDPYMPIRIFGYFIGLIFIILMISIISKIFY